MERWRINHLKSASSPAPTAPSPLSSLSESPSSAAVRHGLSFDDAVGGSSTSARRGIYCDRAPLWLFGRFRLGWKVELNRRDAGPLSPVEKNNETRRRMSFHRLVRIIQDLCTRSKLADLMAKLRRPRFKGRNSLSQTLGWFCP